MARLPDETAIGRATPRSVDSVVGTQPDPIGGAASAFGSGLQQLGRGLDVVAETARSQQDDRDKYDAELGLIKIEKEHRRFLDEQKTRQDGDPTGFAETRKKAFDELANPVLERAPARLKPLIINRLQSLDGTFNNEASNFENTRRDAFHGKQISDTLDGLRGDVASDPAKHAEIRQRGLQLIQDAPISAAAKEKLSEAWKSGAALSAFQADVQRDPDAARTGLGYGASGSLVDRIVGVESGGKANVRNPNSTATGAGQFIESTWMQFIRETRPDLADDRSAALALRNDPKVSREAVAWYARTNARELRRAGFSDTPGNIYLAHFAGPEGAKQVLAADPSASVASVLGEEVVAANPFLRGKTAGWVRDWANKKMDGVSTTATATYADDLSEDQRRQFGSQADRVYFARQEQQRVQLRQQQQALKRDIDDDLASLERTGQGLAETKLNRQRIVKEAGEEAARLWEDGRARSLRVHDAMKDIETLPEQDMDERLRRLEPVPGKPGFEEDQAAFNAAEKRVDRIRKARSADPALSVEALAPVKEARRAAQYEDVGGKRSIVPASAQAIVKARLDAQSELGIQSPLAVTRTEAREIARTLRSIGQENEDGLEKFMRGLRQTYGRYAEDVLSSSLQLQGVNRDLSNTATELLGKIAAGIPPSPAEMRALENKLADQALDNAMSGKAAPPTQWGSGTEMNGFLPPPDLGQGGFGPLQPQKEVGTTIDPKDVRALIEGRMSDYDFEVKYNAGDGKSAATKVREEWKRRMGVKAPAPPPSETANETAKQPAKPQRRALNVERDDSGKVRRFVEETIE